MKTGLEYAILKTLTELTKSKLNKTLIITDAENLDPDMLYSIGCSIDDELLADSLYMMNTTAVNKSKKLILKVELLDIGCMPDKQTITIQPIYGRVKKEIFSISDYESHQIMSALNFINNLVITIKNIIANEVDHRYSMNYIGTFNRYLYITNTNYYDIFIHKLVSIDTIVSNVIKHLDTVYKNNNYIRTIKIVNAPASILFKIVNTVFTTKRVQSISGPSITAKPYCDLSITHNHEIDKGTITLEWQEIVDAVDLSDTTVPSDINEFIVNNYALNSENKKSTLEIVVDFINDMTYVRTTAKDRDDYLDRLIDSANEYKKHLLSRVLDLTNMSDRPIILPIRTLLMELDYIRSNYSGIINTNQFNTLVNCPTVGSTADLNMYLLIKQGTVTITHISSLLMDIMKDYEVSSLVSIIDEHLKKNKEK